MTLITDALDRVARQCGVKAPSAWLSASREEHKEIRDDFLLETVEDIADRVDLPSPIGKQTTITGTGVEQYSLPTDFKRVARGQLAVYDSTLDRHCEPLTTDGEWTYIKDVGTAGVIRYYKVEGYDGNFTISFYANPESSITLTVSYMSNLWMATSGGTAGAAFTDSGDVLLMPRRVVEAGTVWRFRERRGLPYLDKHNEYEALVARLSDDTRQRRIINMGERDMTVKWQDLIPAYIPDS